MLLIGSSRGVVSSSGFASRVTGSNSFDGSLPRVDFRNANTQNTILDSQCPTTSRCNFNSKYRNQDGSCNNKRNPKYGEAKTPLQRILDPAYADGNEPATFKQLFCDVS